MREARRPVQREHALIFLSARLGIVVPAKPKEDALERGRIRRRIEEIEEARRLQREHDYLI